MTKVYIALFTCATSRAVHLELVSSLDAPTFLLCLRRFTGRRGLPKLIVSDNAKTFQASEKTLVSLFELEDVQEHLSSKGIRWQFNLAKAPCWGGFFWALSEASEIQYEQNTRKIEAFIWWTHNYSCRSWSSSEFKTSHVPLFWRCWRASNTIAFSHRAKTSNSTRGTSSNWWLGLWRSSNCYQTFSLSCRSNSAL